MLRGKRQTDSPKYTLRRDQETKVEKLIATTFVPVFLHR